MGSRSARKAFHVTPTALLLALGLSLSLPVAARIVCCDVDGRRTCGDPPPPQCDHRAKIIFGKGGVAREVEAPLTAEQRAAREAEAVRKKEEEKKAAEQARKDRALLDSFTSVKELDAARDRSIADIEKNAEQAKHRLESALARQKKLDQEKEFYLKKPMPAFLKKQIEENEREIDAQRKALAQRDADIAAARARFEADRQRYLQLSPPPKSPGGDLPPTGGQKLLGRPGEYSGTPPKSPGGDLPPTGGQKLLGRPGEFLESGKK